MGEVQKLTEGGHDFGGEEAHGLEDGVRGHGAFLEARGRRRCRTVVLERCAGSLARGPWSARLRVVMWAASLWHWSLLMTVGGVPERRGGRRRACAAHTHGWPGRRACLLGSLARWGASRGA